VTAALDLVRELEEREAGLAALSQQLLETQRAAEDVARGAEEVGELLARLPRERAASDEELAAARQGRDDRRAELEQAQAADDDSEAGRRRVAEAEWALRRAEDHLEQLERAREALEREAEAATASVARLREVAQVAMAVVAGMPALVGRELAPPSPGLDGLREWAPRARAAAFLARGSVDREREALIREAEEAAASLLGESFAGSSVAVVRQRLERPTGGA
jgi:DNA repair exonuclease SbcCD ATPase subunit